MCAVPFRDLHKDDLRLRDLHKIQRLIKERIPTGSATHPPLGACLSSVSIMSGGIQQESKGHVALTAGIGLQYLTCRSICGPYSEVLSRRKSWCGIVRRSGCT